MPAKKNERLAPFDAEISEAYTKEYRNNRIRVDYDGNRSTQSKWAAKYAALGRHNSIVMGATAHEAINKAMDAIDIELDGKPLPTIEDAHPPKKVNAL